MDLTPDWVVGFVDGEGGFYVSVRQDPTTDVGYRVVPEFCVVRPSRDIQVLYALKRFFRCGVVRKYADDRYVYRVQKLECLELICDFFLRHPLKTKKNVEFRKFRRIVLSMKDGRHENPDGLLEIIDTALQMHLPNRPVLEQVRQELRRGQRYGPPPAETSGLR